MPSAEVVTAVVAGWVGARSAVAEAGAVSMVVVADAPGAARMVAGVVSADTGKPDR